MKKKIVIGSSFLILGIITILLFLRFREEGINITVNNNTPNDIEGLYLTYSQLDDDIKLPKVLSESNMSLTFEPDVNESNLILYYYDKEGEKQEEYIIGYFNRGYDAKVNIEINEVEDDGKLILVYEEHISFF
ncbi:hypothetical protein [Bacillus sp. B1-b2]|uniref:hypothetical protein n=1 Tax=Bacillus sp. B1-b2 TaxID=2653201 RepID=UPI001D01D755|nr:hypothetical protein [Bacillus sp. B1-b2]